MHTRGSALSLSVPIGFSLLVLVFLIPGAVVVQGQRTEEGPYFARTNSFGIFAAYSRDSSHMLIGEAEQRKLVQFGVAYGRRLMLNHLVNWQYDAEFMPVSLEGDPLIRFVNKQTSPANGTVTGTLPTPVVKCAPVTYNYNFTLNGVNYSGTETQTCYGRRWTMGEALSPVGFQLNIAPRHTLQPFLIGHGGYMYSTQAIPIGGAGSFNFTFDGGVGIEFYRSKARSIRAEYRYHHFSNNDTAYSNPGVDNGVFQITYSFGR